MLEEDTYGERDVSHLRASASPSTAEPSVPPAPAQLSLVIATRSQRVRSTSPLPISVAGVVSPVKVNSSLEDLDDSPFSFNHKLFHQKCITAMSHWSVLS